MKDCENSRPVIRQEIDSDYDTVYRLIKEAFSTAQHADESEQDLVVSLRKSGSFVPELSLVAEINGVLVGHILFTEALVGERKVLALAPLSVSPSFQRQGIGTALMNEGHRIAKELGYEYSVVLGSEDYYPRVGYLRADTFGIIAPEGIPRENLMAIKLDNNAPGLSGQIVYAAEFGI